MKFISEDRFKISQQIYLYARIGVLSSYMTEGKSALSGTYTVSMSYDVLTTKRLVGGRKLLHPVRKQSLIDIQNWRILLVTFIDRLRHELWLRVLKVGIRTSSGKTNQAQKKNIAAYLDLVHDSSMTLIGALSVSFKITAIHQSNVENSISISKLFFCKFNNTREAMEHQFGNLYHSWGSHDLMKWDKAIDPNNGFVINDIFILNVSIDIIQRESNKITDEPLPSMSRAIAESSVHQKLVFLDVGGKQFKMAWKTLAVFPESLLFKMVQEFPDLIAKREELYIDRNPKAFPWIHEIYRSK